MTKLIQLTVILTLSNSILGFTQSVDLAAALKNDALITSNRNISQYEEVGVELDAKEGDGLSILKNVSFDKGSIELEIKGENAPERSFIGIAFNIENDSTYEAVYFRPFNFVASEPARRSHMV